MERNAQVTECGSSFYDSRRTTSTSSSSSGSSSKHACDLSRRHKLRKQEYSLQHGRSSALHQCVLHPKLSCCTALVSVGLSDFHVLYCLLTLLTATQSYSPNFFYLHNLCCVCLQP
jgi:hypothetical protein